LFDYSNTYVSPDKGTPHKIWENWQSEQVDELCSNCPAYWSRHPDAQNEGQDNPQGIRPSYGDGDLRAKVAVVGWEPGKIESAELDCNDYTKGDFCDVRSNRARAVADVKNDRKHLTHLFDQFDSSSISNYWTQVKKCNEIKNDEEANGHAEALCSGGKKSPRTGEMYDGYLVDASVFS